MEEKLTPHSERICPAEIKPLMILAEELGETIIGNTLIFCSCEDGPQPGRRVLLGVELPLPDKRPGKWICGKTLDQRNLSD